MNAVAEAFGVSALVVAVGEIGDKTQLLALLLATRLRRPLPILLGILAATLLNHGLAGVVGEWIRTQLSPEFLRWAVGLSFLAIAAWALVPDTLDEEPGTVGNHGAFWITTTAFFIAEIGDKTQLATVALAAAYAPLWAVIAGTTAGMLIADAPAVLFAQVLSRRIPFALIRRIAAGLFALLGLAMLLGIGS